MSEFFETQENDEISSSEEMELPSLTGTETDIMSLPREIRGIIYSRLLQEQRVNLRLVCRQWRTEIDDLCEFSAQIDDQRENWERVFQLRLHSCEVLHFLKPPPNGPGTKYLKFPNLLQTLKIMTNSISPENFFYLLSDSAASITQLFLRIYFPLLGKSFETSISKFVFARLISFEMTVSTLPCTEGVPLTTNRNQEIIFSQFMCNPMVNLQHLKIELNVLGSAQVSKMSSSVLQCIASKFKTLQSVDFELMQGHGMPSMEFRPLNDSDLERIDLNVLKKVKQLKSLRVISSSPIGVNLWIDLIENQAKLKYFEADILPVPCSVFQNMILNNSDCLTACEITDLTVWDAEGQVSPFDMSVFQYCANLKKLIVDRNMIARRRHECAELINLYCLPNNLEQLALNYFNILSHDFILFFNTPAGLNLTNLTLNQCGNSGQFGVSGTVLQEIINLQLILFIEVSPLNFTDPEEADKLNSILISHGYSEGHSYFQYSRLESLLTGLAIQFQY